MGDCAGELRVKDRLMILLMGRSVYQRDTSPASMTAHHLLMGTAISQVPPILNILFSFLLLLPQSQQCNVLLFIMLGLHWLDGGFKIVYRVLALKCGL